MGVASLISWFVTAFVGLYLLTVWLIENDVSRSAVRSRLPGPVIGGHVLLAVSGLVCWVVHLLFGSASWGWATLGILAGVATLGLTMFTRWIPVHAAYMAAEAAGSRSAESDFGAERAFPVTVVAIHGVLAVTTVTLVLLTVLGAGGG